MPSIACVVKSSSGCLPDIVLMKLNHADPAMVIGSLGAGGLLPAFDRNTKPPSSLLRGSCELGLATHCVWNVYLLYKTYDYYSRQYGLSHRSPASARAPCARLVAG